MLRIRMAHAVFFLLLAIFQSAPVLAIAPCGHLLLEGRFDEFYQSIAHERETAIRAVKELGEDLNHPFRSQHAALFAGPIISSSPVSLVEISRRMHFKPGQTLIDIGSGHGDPGLVFAALNPELNIVGYDIVPEKVEGANASAAKLGLTNVRFEVQDLNAFPLPPADYYYLFNPVNLDLLEDLARQIRAHAATRDVRIIVYAGGPHETLRKAGFVCTKKLPAANSCIYTVGEVKPQVDPRTDLIPGKSPEYLLKVYKALVHEIRNLTLPTQDRENWRAKWDLLSNLQSAFLTAIARLPVEKRRRLIAQTLANSKWGKDNKLLDALFGLRVEEMDKELENTAGNLKDRELLFGSEEIWYSPGGGQQTRWIELKNHIEAMKLRPGDHVVDIGSGIGRLGILIGYLRPDVQFTGLEIVPERVRYVQEAANIMGFQNVKYEETNLAEKDIPLPPADHYYMFNPTNRETSEIVTAKLLEVAKTKKYRVHLHTGFGSETFKHHFEVVDPSRRGSIYAPKWTLKQLFPFAGR